MNDVPVEFDPIDEAHEQFELGRESGTILRVGRLSLSAGTGSYRVKATMARVARALGLTSHEAHVTLTEITSTIHNGLRFRTEVTEVRSVGINADRLMELERTVTGMPASVPIERVNDELDRIAAKPVLYGPALNALWAAMACAAFAFLNNGGPIELLGVFFAAGLGQLLRRQLIHRGLNQFAVTMLAAILACGVYVAVILGVDLLADTGRGHEAGYTSAVLFLVPGFPLVTGALDLAKLDFSAGVARLTYAMMILMSAAMAVWAFSSVVGLSPDPVGPPDMPHVWLIAARLAASFFGVLGFALMFNSPWFMALGAACVGMVANTLRIEAVGQGLAPQAAAALAAMLVGLLAAVVAPRLDVPRVTVYVPAVVIMVPGVAAYRAVYFLNNSDMNMALGYAVQAGLVVMALAIGLAFGRMLTDRNWLFER
ncbi:MAG: threonine/serine ThrE exporter family protein [Cellulomonadaceae bacterium]